MAPILPECQSSSLEFLTIKSSVSVIRGGAVCSGISGAHCSGIGGAEWSGIVNYWDIALAGDQSFPYVLAAIGGIGHINVYNHNAESKEDLMLRLVDVGIREHYEYLPLLFSLLHPEDDYTNPISQEYYECLLDAAPCTPYNGDVLSVEWSRGDRIGGDRVDVPNGDNAESNTSISPIYYMFYFNLSNEVFYYSAYDFSPIAINQMAIENIHLEFQTEYDKKNYMASNTIIANDYNVGNTLGRNSEDILPIPEIGRVQFVAGEKITLGENFKVIEGASFHASIDHRINARQCSETSFTDCHHILDDARYNENLILFRLKDSVLQAQLYSVKFNDENQFALSSEILLNAIPNPSNGKFTIESNLRDAEMLVMTMTGEVIYSGHYQDGKIEIDLTGLNMGVYILNLRNESATKSIKLVIN
ncbi:MAG: hypothetical protein A2W93_09840 [Bacteroidetes bacterium GWF2_43_63]|nr:MAG: hypothetical protein A2W94_00075 [Bacteroidetes bacterium GWE2_42_42]OFY56156.1 MAG: hypothetical protein A2W93_09840 [Bacteroidetes bacterium GWF2_43_63]